MQRERKC